MRAAAALQKGQRRVKFGVAVLGQRQHDIAANFCKPGTPRPGQRLRSALGGMGAPQPPQLRVAGTLHPKTDTRHTRCAEPRQTSPRYHVRVCFQRDFCPGQGIGRKDQAFDLFRCQKCRRPAAKIQRIRSAVIFAKFPQQRFHIPLRHAPRPRRRIKITISAFCPAIGDVQINSI